MVESSRSPDPSAPSRPAGQVATGQPDVIVEFLLEREALLVVVRNIGSGCAHRIRAAFDPAFQGLGGGVSVPALALFDRLRFLGPGRELRALVDTAPAYFGRGEPEVIDVTVTYSDDVGRHYRRRVSHDLGVFRDLPRPGGA